MNFTKAIALAFTVAMLASSLALVPSKASGATPHSYWFCDDSFSWAFRIRDTTADSTNPNGGAVRYWVRDTPNEKNTDVIPMGGMPYPGMSDIIGAQGQTGIDYFAMLQTAYSQTEPTIGEECVFVMELDANKLTVPRVYINNGVQIGAVPHGYIWAGSDTHKMESDQIVLPSGSPPTSFFEVLEMAAPATYDSTIWSWAGLEYSQPSDIAGNVEAQITSWGLLEADNPDGPWTEVGKAAFGSPIIYCTGWYHPYYCAVPYWKGDVRSLVYSQPLLWSGHYMSRATGPVGTSSSSFVTITYNRDCGCFGWTHLYYSNDRNATWHYICTEESDWEEDGFCYWIPPAGGEYWWLATNDYPETDNPPAPGTPAEAGPCIITMPPPYNIPVSLGWNLISFPVDSIGPPNMVLADAGGDTFWDVVKWYNPQTPLDPWKTYRIGGVANDLTSVNRRMGLWVHITTLGDGVLGIRGNAVTPTSTNLYAGWNLVGYPSLVPRTVSEALAGTGFQSVEVYDPALPYLTEAATDYILSPGAGLWVKVPANAVWTVDW